MSDVAAASEDILSAPGGVEQDAPAEVIAPVAPEAAEGAEPSASEDESSKEQAKTPKGGTPWMKGRIDTLTRQRYEAERQRDQLRHELELERQARQVMADPAAQPQAQQQAPNAPPLTQEQLRYAIEQEAQRLRAAEQWQQDLANTYDAGAKTFGEDAFKESLENFRMLGGIPPALMEAAISTEAPAEVLHRLGQDPDQAQRIMQLPPLRMAVEIARLAAQKPATAPVSSAPPPPAPIGAGRTAPAGLSDDLSDDEWIRRRNAELRANRR